MKIAVSLLADVCFQFYSEDPYGEACCRSGLVLVGPLLAIDLIHMWRLCETDGARLRRGCLSFVQALGRDLSIVSN